MLTIENSEILCNMIFKNMLDSYNKDPLRTDVISLFLEEFDYVRLTLYDDLIVFVEILGQVIFISQLGIFRYLDTSTNTYLDIQKYLSLEYITICIDIDLYSNENNTIDYDCSSKYMLVPLINTDKNGKLKIYDSNIEEDFLHFLYKYMSLYNSLLKVSKICFPYFLN